MTDLLLIVPHPDDEVFACGGLFRRMSDFGRRVATITLTRGGAGRTLGLCEQARLPEVREAELRRSLRALGVTDAHVFDYPDFVTAGDRGLEPRPGLAGADRAELLERLAELIGRHRPRVLLTFPPNGSNGHPDHVATHHLALEALTASGHQPEAVFYFASEQPYYAEERPGFLGPSELRSLHLPPTHYLHLRDEIGAKLQAMGEHETQARSVLMFMRRFTRRLLVEAFHRAQPAQPAAEGPQTVFWL